MIFVSRPERWMLSALRYEMIDLESCLVVSVTRIRGVESRCQSPAAECVAQPVDLRDVDRWPALQQEEVATEARLTTFALSRGPQTIDLKELFLKEAGWPWAR